MPNLEELIKIREEVIKKQEQVLEIIENKIKECSQLYYAEFINKVILLEAENSILSDLDFSFSDEKKVFSDDYNGTFPQWCERVSNTTISSRILEHYINNAYLNGNPIICVSSIKSSDKEEYMYIKPSYIKELAEQDNFNFEVDKSNGITTYQLNATLPKLELPKHKVLTIKD